MNQPSGTADREALDAVERVTGMTLKGGIRLCVLDAGAVWTADRDARGDAGAGGGLAGGIVRKLALLARREGIRIVVRGARDAQRAALEAAVPHEQLVLGTHSDPVDLHGLLDEQGVAPRDCLAVLAVPGALVPEGCRCFYAGPGEPPSGARATRMPGPAATDFILALYGTALGQERAGTAFRNTSQGNAIPSEGSISLDNILEGVRRSVERLPERHPADRQPLPDRGALRMLAGRAYQRLLRNLLPNGAVVGSPAQGKEPGQPNYWFYWQRDGAVTMRHLIDWHQRPPLGLDTRDLDLPIERWLGFVAETQRQGHLGTSRYQVNGQRIGGYGNPQLDGPAHSALALCRLSDPTRGWEQLRRYLDFLLTDEGRGPTMDAWEFIFGRVFNAKFLKRLALLAGARVARDVGHDSDADRYEAEAHALDERLAAFAERGRLVAYRETYSPWFEAISGLDMAVVSALLSGGPPRGSGDRGPGHSLDSLAHPAVLATMMALEGAFESLYQVNRDWRAGGDEGWGLGRFPEDANDGIGSSGGNPWPLATLWGARFYYALAREMGDALKGSAATLTLDDPRSVAFFNRAAAEDLTEQGQPVDAAVWRGRLLPALRRRGDAFLSFVVHHVPTDGGVTEQIDRDTGEPRGARDLSWALSELIATIALREEVYGED